MRAALAVAAALGALARSAAQDLGQNCASTGPAWAHLDDCNAPTTMTCCDGTQGAASGAGSCLDGTTGQAPFHRKLPPIDLASTGASALIVAASSGTQYPSLDAHGLCKMLLDMTVSADIFSVNASLRPLIEEASLCRLRRAARASPPTTSIKS
eukprot:SAG31_NODE_1551_length_7907_cov_29.930072_1_plen_154_part_00